MSNARKLHAQARDERTKEPKEVSRLNLALPIEARQRLEELRQRTNAGSLTETISDALRLYEWVVSTTKEGGKIMVRMPNEEPEIVRFVFR